jgi:hypothetical protein
VPYSCPPILEPTAGRPYQDRACHHVRDTRPLAVK